MRRGHLLLRRGVRSLRRAPLAESPRASVAALLSACLACAPASDLASSASDDGVEWAQLASPLARDADAERGLSSCPAREASGGSVDASSIAALSGVTRILGDLTIEGPAPPDLTLLDCLEAVDGTLRVDGTEGLASLTGLERLTRVGGELALVNNLDLESVSALRALEQVGGDLSILDNLELRTFNGVRALRSVGGSVVIEGQPNLASVDGLTHLANIGGDLVVADNPKLGSLKLPLLSVLPGTFFFAANAGEAARPARLDLRRLEQVSGGVYLVNNQLQLDDGLCALKSIGDYLEVSSNRALRNVDALRALESIGGFLLLANNAGLAFADGLKRLTSLGGGLTVYLNTELVRFGAPALQHLEEDFVFAFNGASAQGSTRFELGSLETVAGSLSVYDNPTWQLQNGLPRLRDIGVDLELSSNAELKTLDGLCALQSVGGALLLHDHERLTSLRAPLLSSVGGNIEVARNPRLDKLSLPQLASLTGSLRYAFNGTQSNRPTRIELGSFGGTTARCDFQGNPKLSECTVAVLLDAAVCDEAETNLGNGACTP